MKNNFSSRIYEELKKIKELNLPIEQINQKNWIMWITPKKGPWKGNKYKVSIELPDKYPDVPPKAKIRDKIDPQHPNIFPRIGHIDCLILCNLHWKPNYNLGMVYREILYLFENQKSLVEEFSNSIKLMKRDHERILAKLKSRKRQNNE